MRYVECLPDCGRCGWPMALDFDEFGGAWEVCTSPDCTHAVRPIRIVDLDDIREACLTIREAQPSLCDSCLAQRHHRCAGCECPSSLHRRA